MMSKNRGRYGFLGTSQVPITMLWPQSSQHYQRLPYFFSLITDSRQQQQQQQQQQQHHGVLLSYPPVDPGFMSWGVASYKIKREDPRWCLARAIWVLLIIKISSEDNVSGQTLPSSFLEYSSGPDFMPFILCRIDFMPFFSREHIKNFFFADFPLSSHKRHKIRIYAGSA